MEMVPERFYDDSWNEVPCKLWTGHRNEKGYGRVNVRSATTKTGRTKKGVHVIAWERRYGPVPSGLCVLHRCDVPACYEVRHLWVGTLAQNNADMAIKGRGRNQFSGVTRCIRGHPLDWASNVYVDRNGYRQCRECRAERWRERTGGQRRWSEALA